MERVALFGYASGIRLLAKDYGGYLTAVRKLEADKRVIVFSKGNNRFTDRDQFPYYVYIIRRTDRQPLQEADKLYLKELAQDLSLYSPNVDPPAWDSGDDYDPFADDDATPANCDVLAQFLENLQLKTKKKRARLTRIKPSRSPEKPDPPTTTGPQTAVGSPPSLNVAGICSRLDSIQTEQQKLAALVDDMRKSLVARLDRTAHTVRSLLTSTSQERLEQRAREIAEGDVCAANKLADELAEYARGKEAALLVFEEQVEGLKAQIDSLERQHDELKMERDELRHEFDRQQIDLAALKDGAGARRQHNSDLCDLLRVLHVVQCEEVFWSLLKPHFPERVSPRRLAESVQKLIDGTLQPKRHIKHPGHPSFCESECILDDSKGRARIYYKRGGSKLVLLGITVDKSRQRDDIERVRKWLTRSGSA